MAHSRDDQPMSVCADQHNITPPKSGDAGYDIHLLDDVWLLPKRRKLIETGVYVQLPKGTVGFIGARSSAAKRGIVVLGGIVDESYRGELKVVLYNTAWLPIRFRARERIVQLLLVSNITPGIVYVPDAADLESSDRGEKGFGERTGR